MSTKVDVRIIAATNQDLLARVRDGDFRQDLFYRLETVTIRVPPLRERPEDIPLLIENINRNEAERMHRKAPVYSAGAIDLLMRHKWLGNVRELKNLVKRLIILRPGEKVSKDQIRRTFPNTLAAVTPQQGVFTLAQAERDHIAEVLALTRGVLGGKSGAAAMLGIPRSTLQYRIKKHGIDLSGFSN